MTTFSILCPTS